MKIISNFLNTKIHQELKNILFSNKFPWFYSDATGDPTDYSNFFFHHWFYLNNKKNSEWFDSIVIPVLNSLNVKYLIRAKANCYTKMDKEITTKFHVDDKKEHSVALYNLNNNNGYTFFKNGQKIKSNENQLILFNGNLEHASVSQTDVNLRINININFLN